MFIVPLLRRRWSERPFEAAVLCLASSVRDVWPYITSEGSRPGGDRAELSDMDKLSHREAPCEDENFSRTMFA